MVFLAGYSIYKQNKGNWDSFGYKSQTQMLDELSRYLFLMLNFHPDITQAVMICAKALVPTHDDLVKFTKSKLYAGNTWGAPGEFVPQLAQIFVGTKFFTEKDLSLKFLDASLGGFTLDQERLNTQKLKSFIGSREVATFSVFISRGFIEILDTLEDIEIYKRDFVIPNANFLFQTRVKDADEYLSYMYHFSHKYSLIKDLQIRKVNNSKRLTIIDFLEWVEDYRVASINNFLNEAREIFKGKSKNLVFIGKQGYFLKNLIEDIEVTYGTFLHFDGSIDIKKITKNNLSIVVYNAEKLKDDDFHFLINMIGQSKNAKRIIILQTESRINSFYVRNFRQIFVPKSEEIKRCLWYLIVYFCSKIFDEKELRDIAFMKNVDYVLACFMMIPFELLEQELYELKAGRHLSFLDFRHRDFWYDYYLYISEKYPSEPKITRLDATESVNSPNDSISLFVFDHTIDNKFWVITNPVTNSTDKIPYRKYLGLYYIIILAKYHHEGNDIETEKLYQLVELLQIRKTNSRSKNVAASISEAISEFCQTQKTELQYLYRKPNGALQKFFRVDKVSSFFNPQGLIRIEVKDPELDSFYNKNYPTL